MLSATRCLLPRYAACWRAERLRHAAMMPPCQRHMPRQMTYRHGCRCLLRHMAIVVMLPLYAEERYFAAASFYAMLDATLAVIADAAYFASFSFDAASPPADAAADA